MSQPSAAALAAKTTRTRRVLSPAPAAFVDPSTSRPAFGSFAGSLPPIVMEGLGLRDRIARRKRWVYLAVVAEGVWIAIGVVRTGYAATAFAFAYDTVGKRMLAEHTSIGPALASAVTADPHGAGPVAHFHFGGTLFDIERKGAALDVKVKIGSLSVDASIDESKGPPGISAIGDLGEGLVNATEKRALLGVRGRARCGAREVDLDGGTAGYDYTHGLLPRHTKWRWAYALGVAESGERIGFNVVQGFVGEAECAAFTEDGVHAIVEPDFQFDATHPEKPWRLAGDGIDLVFEPGAVHAQMTNLVLVRSRFVQPAGTFTGTLEIGGRDVRLKGVPGVVEDQDTLW